MSAGSLRVPVNWRQFAWITLGATAVFVAMRLLPTGTNLSHMDFRATGANVIEFCDPLNPQFISVVAAKSPVTMTVAIVPAARASDRVGGEEVRAVVTLKTGSGKPIGPADLLVTHTKLLHLLVVDPTLTDYQHVHPEPGRVPGEWTFPFRPRAVASYRVFADFTPAATARGLYASADLALGSAPVGSASSGPAGRGRASMVERDGYRFSLVMTPEPVRAGQPAGLSFSIARSDGAGVTMEPVMGAFAHLVAFDEARTGFAHLHPVETDPSKQPDAIHPVLHFKLTIPQPGRYAIWAQVNLEGREMFVPFWIEVN